MSKRKKRAKKANEKRVHKLGDDVMSKFMKQSSELVKPAKAQGQAILNKYMTNPILEEECKWELHSAEETLESFNLTTMVKEGRLGAQFAGNPKMIKIRVPNTHRVSDGDGGRMMKLTIPSKKYDKILNKRCPKNQCRSAKVTIIEDEQGGLMAIIFRGIIPNQLMKQHKHAEEWFEMEKDTMYTVGCKAATYPNMYKIAQQMKNKYVLDSDGLKSSNVKQVIKLSVTGTGGNVRMRYRNAKRNVVDRTFTSAIQRKAYKFSEMKEKPFQELTTFMSELYKNVATYWISRFQCPEDNIDDVVETAMKALKVAFCRIEQHDYHLGTHSDPSSKFPHCIFGNTNYSWDEDANEWKGRSSDGGKLILLDGCVPLDYEPSDVVFLNGNMLHLVTNLKPKAGQKQQKSDAALSRSSMQIYTDYLRNENKHGRYGSFSSWWH